MKKLLIPFVLLAFTLNLPAIHGTIINEDNTAIGGVSVFCGNTGVYSNGSGHFRIDVVCDSLSFYKIGYRKIMRSIVEIRRNPRIVMERESIAIEGVEVHEKRYSPHLTNYAGKRTILIEETASDAASLLEQETGVYMKGGSLPGESRTMSLQGQRSKHTAVMIDGVVVSSSGNAFDLSTIPASMIERIEIIEGNSGAIAGSGAIGGIVNIVTRRDTIPSSDTTLKVLTQQAMGSYDLQKNRLDLSLWNKYSKTDLNFNRLYNRADFEYKDLQDKTKTNINNAVSNWDIGLNQEFFFLPVRNRFQIMYREFTKQMIGTYTMLNSYDDAHLNGNSTRMFLDIDKQISIAQFRLVSHWNREYTLYDNTGSSFCTVGGKGRNHYSSYGADQQTIIDPFPFLRVTPTFSWRSQEYRYDDMIANMNDVDKIRQTALAPHIQVSATTELEGHEVTANFDYRYDHVHTDNIGDDSFDSWKGGLQWKWTGLFGLSLGGNYGTGFSLPSVYDLYWKGGGQAMGNPDLEPEKSRGYLVSSSLWWNDYFKVDAHWSEQEVDDLIFWHKSVTAWKPDNIGSAFVSNFQLDITAKPFPFLSLDAGWQRTISKDSSGEDHDGKFVPGVPSHILNAGMTLQKWNAQIGFDWNRVGERYHTLDNLAGTLPAYETVDLDAKYHLALDRWHLPHPSFYVQVRNLLDKEYEINEGQPEPGTNWEAGFFLETTL